MTQKAKPEFSQYGITHTKLGNDCGDILSTAHTGKLYFVGDNNTLAAAKALIPPEAKCIEFTSPPKAAMETVEHIRRETTMADAIIAVGSGTLNDICKYASFLDGKPYSVIATAPSMNGYVSANASITLDGFKQTLAAHAPTAVICDTDILANAPTRLIQAGIGDSLCRSTVQTDWLLSHYLLGTPYEPCYFDWLISAEEALLDAPHDNAALMESLLLSGIAMREHGSSAPASQGEHMIAHTMEMLHSHIPHRYHGEQIAVTSLTMAKRQEQLLQNDVVNVANLQAFAKLPLSMHKQAQKQTAEKLADDAAIDTLNATLQKDWSKMREKITLTLLASSRLEKALSAASCPITAEDLGWQSADYERAIALARFTRNRFTFLDLE